VKAMKKVWTADELGKCRTLNDGELAFVESRRGVGNRLGFTQCGLPAMMIRDHLIDSLQGGLLTVSNS
jgi:hypothetical protein